MGKSMKFGAMILFLLITPVFCSAATIRVPEDYSIIQQGINAAVDGDTVLVNDGIYEEVINFLGKAITVKSVNGPHHTKIINSDSEHTVTFDSYEDESSVLEGFYIEASYWYQYAVYCYSSSPLITKNIISNSYIGIGCGWDFVTDASPRIINNTIIGNKDNGIFLSSGLYATPEIKNNIIAGNYRGGIHTSSILFLIIDYNNVWGNEWPGWNSPSNYDNCDPGPHDISEDPMFASYEITVSRGESIQEAINAMPFWLGQGSPCIKTGEGGINMGAFPEQNSYGESGARRVIVGSGEFNETIRLSAYIELIGFNKADSKIMQNIDLIGGGGHLLNLTIMGGVDATRASYCIIEDNIITSSRPWPYGCGIRSGEASKKILNNHIVNTSDYAIGVVWRGSDIEIKNNEIVNCSGGILVEDWLDMIIDNNTIIGCWDSNKSAIEVITNNNCPGVIVENNIAVNNMGFGIYTGGNYPSGVFMDYNDVWNNSGGNYGGNAQLGPNDISVDPLFINPDVGHYSLQEISDCIDTGDPSILDPDQTRSNMGAYGGPDAEIVNLTLTPKETQVAPGETLIYTVLLSNNFSNTPTVFVGSEVTLPNGKPYPGNPVLGPMPLTLNSYQTIEREISHNIPIQAPLGNYSYTGKVGTKKAGVIDESSFDFEVSINN